MKGHRSRGRARRVVVAGFGQGFQRIRPDDIDSLSIRLSLKEKRDLRYRRAVKKQTPMIRLGRAIRGKVEQMREMLRLTKKPAVQP
jgi:hypothetical protein